METVIEASVPLLLDCTALCSTPCRTEGSRRQAHLPSCPTGRNQVQDSAGSRGSSIRQSEKGANVSKSPTGKIDRNPPSLSFRSCQTTWKGLLRSCYEPTFRRLSSGQNRKPISEMGLLRDGTLESATRAAKSRNRKRPRTDLARTSTTASRSSFKYTYIHINRAWDTGQSRSLTMLTKRLQWQEMITNPLQRLSCG